MSQENPTIKSENIRQKKMPIDVIEVRDMQQENIERHQEVIGWLGLFVVTEMVIILVCIGFVHADSKFQLFSWIVGMIGFGTVVLNGTILWFLEKKSH